MNPWCRKTENKRKGGMEIKLEEQNEVHGYQSKLFAQLASHERMLPETELHKCRQCSENFLFASSLHEHEKTHSPMNANVHLEELEQIEICVDNSKVSLAANLKQSEQFEYACTDCDEKFRCPNSLLLHEKLHTDKKRLYDCCECEQKFSCPMDLLIHKREHSGEICRMGQFPDSGDVFPSLSSSIHDVKEICDSLTTEDYRVVEAVGGHGWLFCCSRCNRKFEEKRHLKLHMRVHTAEMPYSFDPCNEKFDPAISANVHSGLSHQTMANVDECDADLCKFDQQPNTFRERFKVYIARKKTNIGTELENSVDALKPLNNHESRYIFEAESYYCDWCNERFSSQYLWHEHQRLVHSGKKLYSCDQCDAKFARQAQKTLHIFHMHFIKSGKIAKKSRRLKDNHISKRADKKISGCDECDNEYTSGVTVLSHQKIELAPETVPNQIKNEQSLIEMRTNLEHSSSIDGENMYNCNECKKTFSSVKGLRIHGSVHKFKRHRKSHLPSNSKLKCTKIHNCRICRRRFASAKGLKIHFAVHSIKIKRSRKRRLPVISNEIKIKSDSIVEIYACDQCSDFFVDRHALREHVETMHCDVKKDDYEGCGKPSEIGGRGDHTAVIEVKPVDCNECEMKCEVAIDHGTNQFENHLREKSFDNDVSRATSVEQEHKSVPEPSGMNLELKPFGCGKCCASFAKPEEAVACFYNHTDL